MTDLNKIEGNKIELKDLLTSDNFFLVPYYQRPYSWDTDNFEDLINDLLNADRSKQYFLGTIVLHKNSDHKINEIVDGQQRLTTIMILLATLRDLINDGDIKAGIQEKIIQRENKVDGIPEKDRLEVKDRQIFKELITEPNGTNTQKDISRLPEPEFRYVQAINVFKNKLSVLSQEELVRFVQFLSQNCVFIYLSTNSFDDAFRMFTIVNDRGKQLRRIDILKARTISPDLIHSEPVRNSVAQTWEYWEKSVGEEDFENILYLIRFIFLEEKPYNDLLFEYEEKIFKTNKLQRGETFANCVFSYASIYNSIFGDLSFFDEKENCILLKNFTSVLIKEFKSYEWKACLLQIAIRFPNENLIHILNKIELKYLEGILLGQSKDTRTSDFGKIMSAINNSTTYDELLNSSSFNVNINLMKNELGGNIYSKTYCKYILLRLELLQSEHTLEQRFEAKSIEHILPQTLNPTSQWAIDFTSEQHTEWLNKISNLVLLSKGKNSSASNLDFEIKKERYLRKKISQFPRSLEVITIPVWNVETLQNRQVELMNVILDKIE
jgi:Protein of unknown function DUF262/Protein of unknown function (DUF1524)